MKYTPTSIARADHGGFTLVEIMIVVAIIGLLCAIAIPGISNARTMSQRVYLTEEIKDTAEAFEMYEADHNGMLPLQSPGSSMVISTAGVVPPGMSVYMPKNSHWTNGSYGTWYWIYWPQAVPGYQAMIYLYNPQMTDADIAFFDQKLDDGNPNTGSIIEYGSGTLVDLIQ
jgi:prepilin-type N-terminal cleavage/methylation domain-containing protein